MNKTPYINIEKVFDRFYELYGDITENQKSRYIRAFETFKKTFGVKSAFVASSSGRVEVCGNHTDHNGGRVVSCAISLDTLAMFLPSTDNVIRIFSEGYPEIEVNLDKTHNVQKGTSAALVCGVVDGLKKKNFKIGGFNATFTSNVAGGVGISSSASFEVLVVEILNFLYNDGKIDTQTKAIVSQYAENEYFGKPCGLLDQTAIAFGGLKKLDFSNKNSIKVEAVNNNLKDHVFVLINTGGSHADLTDEYSAITKEMRAVAEEFGKERLIDVGEKEFYEKLPEIYNKLPDRAILRAIHFFEENKRVDLLFKSLNNNEYDKFIDIINQSGISSLNKLQNCYVAGGDDQLIPKALAVAERYAGKGAVRVHGGGFAGSILCVIKLDDLNCFVDNMKQFYKEESIIPLRVRSVGTIVL